MGLDSISRRLHRWSTGRAAVAATAVFVVFAALVLPRITDGGDSAVPTPDIMLTYSAAALYHIAGVLGETGRNEYIWARFTFDVVWPVLYTAFLALTIGWLTDYAFAPASLWQKANLLPLAAALFDFLENVSTSLVMARYPQETAVIAELAGLFTLVKWIMVAICGVALAFTAVQAVRHKTKTSLIREGS